LYSLSWPRWALLRRLTQTELAARSPLLFVSEEDSAETTTNMIRVTEETTVIGAGTVEEHAEEDVEGEPHVGPLMVLSTPSNCL